MSKEYTGGIVVGYVGVAAPVEDAPARAEIATETAEEKKDDTVIAPKKTTAKRAKKKA